MDGGGAQTVDAAPRLDGAPTAETVAAENLRAIVGDWRDLAARAVEPNAFYGPAMLLPALDAFAGEKPEVVVLRRPARRARPYSVASGLFAPSCPLCGDLDAQALLFRRAARPARL